MSKPTFAEITRKCRQRELLGVDQRFESESVLVEQRDHHSAVVARLGFVKESKENSAFKWHKEVSCGAGDVGQYDVVGRRALDIQDYCSTDPTSCHFP